MAEQQQAGQKQPSFLAKIYYGLEDAYYKIMEFFQNKLHVPLVKYFVEPIEKHNIPSMPVALLILIAIVGGLFFAFGGGFALPAQKIPFTVSVMSADGTPLDGASVTLSGTGFKETVTSANGVAEFMDVPKGAALLLTIKKDGYTTITKRLTISEKGYEAKMATAAVTPASPSKEYLKNQGYNTNQVASMSDDDAEKLAAGLGYQKSGVQVNVGVKVIDSSSNAPLEAASVNYEPGSGTEYSGSDGIASFQVSDGATVSISASKDGYNPGISSFTAEDGYVATVRLTKRTSTSKPAGSDNPATSTDPVTTSNVIVVVKGVDNTGKSVPVSHAKVTLTLPDYTELASVPEVASDSPITFSAIPVGTEVVAVVTANGFSATKTTKKTVETGKDLSITATLTLLPPCPSNNCTTGEMDFQVSVKDDKNRSIGAAKVFLLDADDAVLNNATTDASGLASMKAEAGTFARIFVTADKYISVYSDDLELGIDNNFNASLVLGTVNNSATLSIKVTEFDGKAAPGAFTKVGVTASGLRKMLLPIQKVTSSSGIADYTTMFPIGWKAEASAVGANLGFIGAAAEITLQAGKNNVTVTLFPNDKDVTFKAVDVYTKDFVQANFTTYLRNSNVVLASCEQTTQAGCVQKIYANVDYDLKVTSLTHLGRTVQVPKLSTDPNTDNTIVVDLLPSTLEQTTFVGLCKDADLTDCEGTAGDYGTLQVSQTYYAKFLVKIANGSDSYGFVVRAGDKSGLFADDAAIVRSQAALTLDSIWSEGANNTILAARGQPKTGCGGIETSNGLYKVVSLTSKNVNQSFGAVVVPFIVTSKTRPSFKLYYAAWNLVNGSYIREPYDDAFKDAALPANSWCSPAMVNVSYKVDDTMAPQAYPSTLTPKHHFLCGPQACLELRYSQNISDGSINRGGNGFVVDVPYTPATEPVSIAYTLTDFDPDPEEFSTLFTLTGPATRLAFQTPNPYLANYSGAPFGKQKNIGGGTASDTITAWPLEAGTAILQATYGTKLALMESVMLLTSKFRGTVENTYYVHYNAEANNGNGDLEIGVKNETNEFVPRPAITLNSSPVMPADAVYLKLDYESLPPECTDARIQFMPLPACFAFDNTQEILKFDASSSVVEGAECPYYNNNPNDVTGTNSINTPTQKSFTINGNSVKAEAIRFAVFCTGLNTKEFPVTITRSDLEDKALVLVRIPARAPSYYFESPAVAQKQPGPAEFAVNRTVFAPIVCDKNAQLSYLPNKTTSIYVGNSDKWTRTTPYDSKWSDLFRCRMQGGECDVSGSEGAAMQEANSPFYNAHYALLSYLQIENNTEYLPYQGKINNLADYYQGLDDYNVKSFFPRGGAYFKLGAEPDASAFRYLNKVPAPQENLQPFIYVLVNNRQYGTIDRIRVLVDNFPLQNPQQETVFKADKPGIISVFAATSTTGMLNVTVGDLPSVIDKVAIYPVNPSGTNEPFIDYNALPYDPSYIGALKKFGQKNAFHRTTTADLDYKPFPLVAFKPDGVVEMHWFFDNASAMRVVVPGCPRTGEGMFDFSQTLTDLKEASFPKVGVNPLKLSMYAGPIEAVCSNPVETTLCGRNYFALKQADGSTCIQSSWDAQQKVFGDPVADPCNADCVLDDQCDANNSKYTLKLPMLNGESFVCMRDNPVGFEDAVPRGACLKLEGTGKTGSELAAYGPQGKVVEVDPDIWSGQGGMDDKGEVVMETLMAHPDLARAMADLGDKNTGLKPVVAKHTLTIPTAPDGDLDNLVDSDVAVYLNGNYRLSIHEETHQDDSDECYFLPAANDYYCPLWEGYTWERVGLYSAIALGSLFVPGGPLVVGLVAGGAAFIGETTITGYQTESFTTGLKAGAVSGALTGTMAGLGAYIGGGAAYSKPVVIGGVVIRHAQQASLSLGYGAAVGAAVGGAAGGAIAQNVFASNDFKGSPLFVESETTAAGPSSMKAADVTSFADASTDAYIDRLAARGFTTQQISDITASKQAILDSVNETNYLDVKTGAIFILNQTITMGTFLEDSYLFPKTTNTRLLTKDQLTQVNSLFNEVRSEMLAANTPEAVGTALFHYAVVSPSGKAIQSLFQQSSRLYNKWKKCQAKLDKGMSIDCSPYPMPYKSDPFAPQ